MQIFKIWKKVMVSKKPVACIYMHEVPVEEEPEKLSWPY